MFFGRVLVLLMVVGALGTLGEHYYVWAACFAGSALLAWVLLRRWRGLPVRRSVRRRVPAVPARGAASRPTKSRRCANAGSGSTLTAPAGDRRR